MNEPVAPRRIRVERSLPRQRDFWLHPARFRLLCGGGGAGKTRAGAVEVLRQPRGSRGVVVAPTYPMLRDETMRTTLMLAERAGVLAEWHATETRAVLTNGSSVMFRSADRPDRLRGPNLGWFWMDEAALCSLTAWRVLRARLRLHPGRGWLTTTPRGFTWLHDRFVARANADHAVVFTSSRDNTFLPPDFVRGLEEDYPLDWLQQEVEGRFVGLGASVFRREWFRRVVEPEQVPVGLSWVRHWDLATSTRASADYTAGARCAMAEDGTLFIADLVRGRWEWPEARKNILATAASEPQVDTIGIEAVGFQSAAVQEMQREGALADRTVLAVKVDKDKLTRALPWAARAERGQVALVAGEWVAQFVSEAEAFPRGAHDDAVDAVSGAVQMLAAGRTGPLVAFA